MNRLVQAVGHQKHYDERRVKYYVGLVHLAMGRRTIELRKHHRTATEANEYAVKVVDRFYRLQGVVEADQIF